MITQQKVLEPIIIDGVLYVRMTPEELAQINSQLQKFAESRKKSREWMAQHKKPKKEVKQNFVIKPELESKEQENVDIDLRKKISETALEKETTLIEKIRATEQHKQ